MWKIPLHNREYYGDRIVLRPLQHEDSGRILQWENNGSELLVGYDYGEMEPSEAGRWYRIKTGLTSRYFAIDIKNAGEDGKIEINNGSEIEKQVHSTSEKNFKNVNNSEIVNNSESEKLIGYVGIRHIRQLKREGTLGIVLNPRFQDKGYGKEAMEVFLNICFSEWKMNAVNLEVNFFNKKAISLYEGCGFVKIEESSEAFENQLLDFENPDLYELKDDFFYRGRTIYSRLWKMRKEAK